LFFSKWFRGRGNRQPGPEEPPLYIRGVCVGLEDRFLLERLAPENKWKLRFANSPREGFSLAAKQCFDVILCDRNQPGYPWREVLDEFSQTAPRSCILLLSPANDDYLWGEVVQHGGHDIVRRPLREQSALRAIETARLRQFAAHVG